MDSQIIRCPFCAMEQKRFPSRMVKRHSEVTGDYLQCQHEECKATGSERLIMSIWEQIDSSHAIRDALVKVAGK